MNLVNNVKRIAWNGRVPSPAATAAGLLALLLLLAVLLIWVSPNERTLGSGIKAVYVHVSLTYAGLAGFVTAGLLGLAELLLRRRTLAPWRRLVGWVAFAFYLSGVAASAIASQVNWGAVFWQEPRMVTSLNVLAAALIVQMAVLFPWWWLQAALSVLLPPAIVWANVSAPLVLHPPNALRNSESSGIQLAFLGMFVLMFLAGSVITWYLRETERGSGSNRQ